MVQSVHTNKTLFCRSSMAGDSVLICGEWILAYGFPMNEMN